jgi:hypothetical protein
VQDPAKFTQIWIFLVSKRNIWQDWFSAEMKFSKNHLKVVPPAMFDKWQAKMQQAEVEKVRLSQKRLGPNNILNIFAKKFGKKIRRKISVFDSKQS